MIKTDDFPKQIFTQSNSISLELGILKMLHARLLFTAIRTPPPIKKCEIVPNTTASLEF